MRALAVGILLSRGCRLERSEQRATLLPVHPSGARKNSPISGQIGVGVLAVDLCLRAIGVTCAVVQIEVGIQLEWIRH